MNISSIDLRLLRSFVSTARLGSVTKAAHALHLTQPALSQHLRELAAHIGVPLLERVGRGVALTPAGDDFFRELEPLLGQLDLVLTSVRDRSREVKGAVRVGAIDTYSRALVVPAITRLITDHPQLTVSVEEMPAAEIDRRLLEGDIDVGVSFSHLSHADIEQRMLFEESLMLIRRARKFALPPGDVTLEAVAAQRLALLKRGFEMRHQIDTAFAHANLPIDVRVEVANVDSLVRMAEGGQVAVIASGLAVRDHRRLEVRPIAHRDLTRIAALRWRRGRSLSPAVQRFTCVLIQLVELTR